jgi:peptidoglycan/LPS O-acetylase OafA/YrhL
MSTATTIGHERKLNPWGSGQMPSLDGWRALSICLVLLEHARHTVDFPVEWAPMWEWLSEGKLGVRCFFIISGFLITTLMLREAVSIGRVDLKGFYLRRAVRILPVYLAFLGFIALLQLFTSYHETQGQWAHLLTFTANFNPVRTWNSGHIWSLSCEEQFYMFWPAIFLLLGLTAPKRIGVILLLLATAVSVASRAIESSYMFLGGIESPPWSASYILACVFYWSSLLNYLDSLAIGCTLAYIHPWLGRKFNSLRISLPIAIIGVLCIAGPYLMQHLNLKVSLVKIFGPFIQAIGMASLISLSIHQAESGVFRLLNLSAVRWLGRLSYSLYIWQQFFSEKPEVFGWQTPIVQSFYTWIPISMLVASASYYLLETPLVNLRKRLHGRPAERKTAPATGATPELAASAAS